MKKIMVSLVSFAFALLPFNTASAYSHANRYGGSTSHSDGSTSTPALGTSSSHTVGEVSSHTNEYGGSSSHNSEWRHEPHQHLRRHHFGRGRLWCDSYRHLRRNNRLPSA